MSYDGNYGEPHGNGGPRAPRGRRPRARPSEGEALRELEEKADGIELDHEFDDVLKICIQAFINGGHYVDHFEGVLRHQWEHAPHEVRRFMLATAQTWDDRKIARFVLHSGRCYDITNGVGRVAYSAEDQEGAGPAIDTSQWDRDLDPRTFVIPDFKDDPLTAALEKVVFRCASDANGKPAPMNRLLNIYIAANRSLERIGKKYTMLAVCSELMIYAIVLLGRHPDDPRRRPM